jgi:hypothetical protein
MRSQLIKQLLSIVTLVISLSCNSQRHGLDDAKHQTVETKKTTPNSSFKPGKPWYDDKGEIINAHGGGIIFANNKYYWFGEKCGRRPLVDNQHLFCQCRAKKTNSFL